MQVGNENAKPPVAVHDAIRDRKRSLADPHEVLGPPGISRSDRKVLHESPNVNTNHHLLTPTDALCRVGCDAAGCFGRRIVLGKGAT